MEENTSFFRKGTILQLQRKCYYRFMAWYKMVGYRLKWAFQQQLCQEGDLAAQTDTLPVGVLTPAAGYTAVLQPQRQQRSRMGSGGCARDPQPT